MIRQPPVTVYVDMYKGRYQWRVWLAAKYLCILRGTTTYATKGAAVTAGRRAFSKLFDRGDQA